MTSEKIELSKKENDRVQVLVSAGESGRANGEVARALGLSVQQVQRLKKALRPAAVSFHPPGHLRDFHNQVKIPVFR
jgi:fatty acid/phospholipid biosynthesis enzyme